MGFVLFFLFFLSLDSSLNAPPFCFVLSHVFSSGSIMIIMMMMMMDIIIYLLLLLLLIFYKEKKKKKNYESFPEIKISKGVG